MNNRILIAISGGVDSMVLLHRLMSENPIQDIALAHCNFQLRGEESDADERFVQETSDRLGVKLFLKRFKNEEFAQRNGLSIQETARKLRYDWFFELKQKEGYDCIATAHHLDDSIETFFINLLRGSGPRGLSGISEDESRGIIRPLLGLTRKEILVYALDKGIAWREDSSNRSKKYLRNRIRNELLPLLEAIRPGFWKTMKQNMLIQSQISSFIDDSLHKYLNDGVEERNGALRMKLNGGAEERVVLHRFLSRFSFSVTQIENILDTTQSGKQVFSSSHIITRQGDELLLNTAKTKIAGSWIIREDLETSHLPINVKLEFLDSPPKDLNTKPELVYLDYKALKFPLILRNWKEGDRFIPFGMKGQKKLSDYLIDKRVSLQDKKNVLVLESDDRIVWLVGFRMDDRFKITTKTDKVLAIRINESMAS